MSRPPGTCSLNFETNKFAKNLPKNLKFEMFEKFKIRHDVFLQGTSVSNLNEIYAEVLAVQIVDGQRRISHYSIRSAEHSSSGAKNEADAVYRRLTHMSFTFGESSFVKKNVKFSD